MYRLFSLSALLLFVTADPRTPKIYNVLISSKKNLSPSHVLPVYEPVLRTTSYGFAVPPFFYHSPVPFGPSYVSKSEPVENTQNPDKTQNNEEQGSSQPLPVERFIPYYTPHILNSGSYYTPVNELNANEANQPQPQPKPNVVPSLEEPFHNSEDPKHTIANLKRNPNIPDVPPPALPTRRSS